MREDRHRRAERIRDARTASHADHRDLARFLASLERD